MNQLPQLQMKRRLECVPPGRPVPDGFLVRVAVREDAPAIATVLTDSFEVEWDTSKVNAELFDDPNVPVTFVVERAEEIVATASYQTKPETDPESFWLHWVGVHTSSRGMALGEILSLEVLNEGSRRGRKTIYLTTDDFRLAAIRTYLKLGFEPDSIHDSHRLRWKVILAELGYSSATT